MAVDPNALPYRPCAGVMLLNAHGQVFVGNRVDQSLEAWQMPQGGIDEGETPVAAAFRELEEEIGTRKAKLLREHPAWLNYDLPPNLVGVALQGKYRGQTQKWFAMRFLGEDGDINLSPAGHKQEFSNWRWVAAEELPRLIVPFKRDIYTQILAAFRDLTTPA